MVQTRAHSPTGWGAVAGITVAIFGVSGAVAPLRRFGLGEEVQLAVGVAIGLAFVAWVMRAHGAARVVPPVSAGVAIVAAVPVLAAASLGRLSVERMHVLTFGPLGFALARVLGASHGRVLGSAMALAWALWTGVADEFLQGFLADRYYDLGDVRIDGLAAVGGIVLAAPLARSPARVDAARSAALVIAVLAGASLVATWLVRFPTLAPGALVGTWDGENPCGPEQLRFAADGALGWKDRSGNHAAGRWWITGNAFRENVLFLRVEESVNRHRDPLCGLRADGELRGLYAAPLAVEGERFVLGGTRKRAWQRVEP